MNAFVNYLSPSTGTKRSESRTTLFSVAESDAPVLAHQVDRKKLKKVVVFGGTGMVGKGVLRECLEDKDVESVVAVVRKPSDFTLHEKLHEVKLSDCTNVEDIKKELEGVDAAFYAFGVLPTSKKEEYEKVTKTGSLKAAQVLGEASPQATFVFVSGAYSNAESSMNWSKIKGEAENDILALTTVKGYVFRPGGVRPMYGEKPASFAAKTAFSIAGPFLSVAKSVFPSMFTTTVNVGQSFLHVARYGSPKRILENDDINDLAEKQHKPL